MTKGDASPNRRFNDLYNLVYDPAVLAEAWHRVRGNKGARSAGVDRQTAHYISAVRAEDTLKLVLEPIFEADSKPVSYGFRPKRRAQDAIAEIHAHQVTGWGRWSFSGLNGIRRSVAPGPRLRHQELGVWGAKRQRRGFRKGLRGPARPTVCSARRATPRLR